jgi:dihydroxyacetone kinase-like protein
MTRWRWAWASTASPVAAELGKRGINVRRSYVGEYCTSLDMAGASLTLSRLDPEIDELLGAPAEIAIRTF